MNSKAKPDFEVPINNPRAVQALQQLPSLRELDDSAAQERLYPSPVGEGKEELADEWKAYVEPDLREHFTSSREIVKADLRNLKADADGTTLRIPNHHLEAWVNVLTQARLAMVEAHQFTEEELTSMKTATGDDRRQEVLLNLSMYGFLLELLIYWMDQWDL